MDVSSPRVGRPSEGGWPRPHFHAYRWSGDRRTYDREGPRRPGSAEFANNPCTPVRISDWLLRPAGAIAATFREVGDTVAWFEEQVTIAAPGFASVEEREPARLAAKVAHVEGVLRRGGDTHAAWYVQATSYHTLDLIACSPNRANPGLPCPVHPGGRAGAGMSAVGGWGDSGVPPGAVTA
ncbi:hypothetical protein [Streptomyces mayteni]